MEKKIQDYLHLYPKVPIAICEPGVEAVGHYLEGYDWVLNKAIAERVNYDPSWIKPILRPLESMTEEECADVYTIERDRLLHPPTNEHDVRRENGAWKVVRLDLIDTTLFITDNGIVYKVTIENWKPMIEYTRNLPEIIHYLLSRHFDLFGLIKAGLAISSPTKQ